MFGKSHVLTACFAALAVVCCARGLALAAADGEAAAAQTAERSVDPHKAHFRFHFEDPEMDFVFGSLILGAAVNHGCEIGEAFATAARIKDGDALSWQKQWIATAGLVEARGERSLAAGHTVSARDQFLRACYYYRAALVSMLPDDPRLKPISLRARSLMQRAGALMQPPMEYFEIPFEGGVMPGFFRKASPGDAPAKTLIMIGGAETFAEDQIFFVAPQAFERGYNFLTVDLPGQGLLPLEGKFFRPAMDVPIRAVVDYALSRGDVDPERLAVYGISSGGGFVPQAAEHDQRIRAVVMNNCVVDAAPGVAKMAVATATPEVTRTWTSFKRQTNQSIAWRFGVDMNNLPGLVEANRGFSFDPAKVDAPALVLVANGEYQSPEIQRQTKLCLDCLASARKDLVISPAEEGASNHCIMENRSLMSQVVFDWLDETFKK
jgi:pimeloyl-ACP methyl ester carboxylesterase